MGVFSFTRHTQGVLTSWWVEWKNNLIRPCLITKYSLERDLKNKKTNHESKQMRSCLWHPLVFKWLQSQCIWPICIGLCGGTTVSNTRHCRHYFAELFIQQKNKSKHRKWLLAKVTSKSFLAKLLLAKKKKKKQTRNLP